MLRTIKNKMTKIEDAVGKERGAPIIIVEPWETSEQAEKRHLREYPEDQDCPVVILIRKCRRK
jgi:hypothetical protein